MNDPRALASAWLLHHRWNFRAAPPEASLTRYLKAVMCCANGDGRLAPSERAWVVGYGACLGLSEASLDALRAYEATDPLDAETLRDAGLRVGPKALLCDAIHACMADHDYRDAEAQAIRAAAKSLGVSEAVVTALEALAHEERALRAQRLELAFSDEPDA